MSDERFMRAALRLAMRHSGRTGTNPAVGTLIVQDGVLVGRGITALGGRPHAEPIALAEAGDRANGATAYVSLEPCAHHGVTPPCAEALIVAGIARVVTAYVDPDRRVDGQGHAILRAAGIAVEEGVATAQASSDLAGYLNRQTKQRPHVTLKLAQSADGFIGRAGEEVAITGPTTRAQVHAMRARADAILVGIGTVRADDPDLTCRLPGMESRSPHRFVLDSNASLAPSSRLAETARETPVTLVSADDLPVELADHGCHHLRAEAHNGELALPEILSDMAATGVSNLMVEGGAAVAGSFLDAGLVDRLVIFTAPHKLGRGIASPVDEAPARFDLTDTRRFGEDTCQIWERR